jgi:hypothetical protein
VVTWCKSLSIEETSKRSNHKGRLETTTVNSVIVVNNFISFHLISLDKVVPKVFPQQPFRIPWERRPLRLGRRRYFQLFHLKLVGSVSMAVGDDDGEGKVRAGSHVEEPKIAREVS